ncbi:MAG: hypothetical protein J5784_01975 [Muribaculaceae bacterium]|nr:hypothetical protein [Muribaculaceae bacterium]
MNKPKIFTITSPLHDAAAIAVSTSSFLSSIDIDCDFAGDDYEGFNDCRFPIIFVRTGGTESVFLNLVKTGKINLNRRIYLLASNSNNSLAASMEILSYLRRNNCRGEIIHGAAETIRRRIEELSMDDKKTKARLGVIGQPSDWLISSGVDYSVVMENAGVELVDIAIEELEEEHSRTADCEIPVEIRNAECCQKAKEYIAGAIRLKKALDVIAAKYHLDGFTLRCFDLLTAIHNTGCLALSMFNSESKVATCEGDIPAMLSMWTAREVTGTFGFQANPSRMDTIAGEMIFAHCTVPFNLVERFSLDTHFESGIGVGICGKLKEGPVTVLKISGDMSRYFIAEGRIDRNLCERDLCRTQVAIRFNNPGDVFKYFMNRPIGNHHIIIPGNNGRKIEAYMKSMGAAGEFVE